jgi:hypothetical protein
MRETSWGRVKYRTTNWKAYNAALKARGELTIWLDRDMQWCIDPVNSCSGVNVEGNDDEHPDGRRHQALDSQA